MGLDAARSALQPEQVMVKGDRKLVHEIPKNDPDLLSLAMESRISLGILDCIAHGFNSDGSSVLTDHELKVYNVKRMNRERSSKGRLGRYKQYTGFTDQEIADFFGVSRQAITKTWLRIKEKLKRAAKETEA